MDTLTNPDAIIRFTVERFISVTQGTMMTSGAVPDVKSTLVDDYNGRVKMLSNSSFELTGADATGRNGLWLQLEVVSDDQDVSYDVVEMIIKNVNNVNEGGDAWDQVKVGNPKDNMVTLRNHGRKPDPVSSIPYEIYLLIKPVGTVPGYPIGDVGLIDPLWTNRR
jgi:hypothetical protein